ncbi:MAG: oxaloacetate decarboxylase (Na+ extruding) subunit alpha [Miltoncostaeaceae bacterium]|nr:oxaloacetate decarboxylase (Na+ extruding) subunit alpha [Miltoncostaeaceae bacterium]
MSDPVGYVDATLRDLAPLPWGSAVGADDLSAAAAALGVAGAVVLEALDPRCARAAMEARSESPWDRLRAMVREAGTTPVGVVAGGRNLWGERTVAPDVVRQFVLCAAESGARRFRATDPLNDPAAMEAMARAAAEAGAEFVPTLIVGPVPGRHLDPSRIEEARALAALPGARRLCVSDGAGHLSPAGLAALVEAVREATGLPIEVQVQAPGGLAPLSATAAVAAGAAAVQASAGPVALVAARPSAETLRAALLGGPRELACERAELDRAARVVAPMLPADRLRQAAAAVFGPAIAVPPALEAGLVARLGRLGLSRRLVEVAEESAAVARDVGWATLGYPLGAAIVAQAARHIIEGRRWAEIEPELVPVALGRAGRLRGDVDPAALEAATAADLGPEPERDLAAVAAEVPFGLSDEDEVLWAMFGETAGRIVERRRSLRTEAEDRPAQQAIDRELLATLVEVVDTVGEAEVTVEIGGARVTVRRAGAAPDMPRHLDDDDDGDPDEGLIRVESPMVGTFYRAPSPDVGPFVEEGQRVAAGDTLCLIEAMKLFNEIQAEHGGVVRRILIENAEPAEFGQLLFLIEP